jgi:hypothetical protein
MVTEAAGKYQETHKREITDRESGLIFLGGTQVGAFTQRLCNSAIFAFEQSGIFVFKYVPWNGICHLDPAVIGIHMKA